jgi:hypothetical protein
LNFTSIHHQRVLTLTPSGDVDHAHRLIVEQRWWVIENFAFAQDTSSKGSCGHRIRPRIFPRTDARRCNELADRFDMDASGHAVTQPLTSTRLDRLDSGVPLSFAGLALGSQSGIHGQKCKAARLAVATW